MSSSVCVKNRGADHRANSGASYAADRPRQALRRRKIRIRDWRLFNSIKRSHHRAVLSLVAKNWAGKPQTIAFLRFLVVFLTFSEVACGFNDSHEATAAPPAPPAVVSPALATKLTADFRVSLIDKPLREALASLADAAQINVWLDRRVDPTTLISTDASANTVYLAIVSAAKSANLDVHAVDSVILVGRVEWIDRTAAAIRELPRLGDPANVQWPELTTPSQAYLACTQQAEADLVTASQLPHDLWPELRWSAIPSEIAKLMVTAQFDLKTSTNGQGLIPITVSPRCQASYPLGKHTQVVRSVVTASDQRATLKDADNRLVVTATSAAHRLATDAWLRLPAVDTKKTLDVDKVKFTLRLQNAVIEQVLQQLATTSGRKLAIHADVASACKQPISLEVKDESLRELSQRIGNEAGVQVSWTDSELQVNARP